MTSRLKTAAAVLGAVIIGAAALARLTDTPEARARSAERQAIRHCWDAQGRKSLDAPTARFMAATCERMERDYEAKHRRSP